jgi:hypothetical protein
LRLSPFIRNSALFSILFCECHLGLPVLLFPAHRRLSTSSSFSLWPISSGPIRTCLQTTGALVPHHPADLLPLTDFLHFNQNPPYVTGAFASCFVFRKSSVRTTKSLLACS